MSEPSPVHGEHGWRPGGREREPLAETVRHRELAYFGKWHGPATVGEPEGDWPGHHKARLFDTGARADGDMAAGQRDPIRPPGEANPGAARD
jgi:hypothetical protein